MLQFPLLTAMLTFNLFTFLFLNLIMRARKQLSALVKESEVPIRREGESRRAGESADYSDNSTATGDDLTRPSDKAAGM